MSQSTDYHLFYIWRNMPSKFVSFLSAGGRSQKAIINQPKNYVKTLNYRLSSVTTFPLVKFLSMMALLDSEDRAMNIWSGQRKTSRHIRACHQRRRADQNRSSGTLRLTSFRSDLNVRVGCTHRQHGMRISLQTNGLLRMSWDCVKWLIVISCSQKKFNCFFFSLTAVKTKIKWAILSTFIPRGNLTRQVKVWFPIVIITFSKNRKSTPLRSKMHKFEQPYCGKLQRVFATQSLG